MKATKILKIQKQTIMERIKDLVKGRTKNTILTLNCMLNMYMMSYGNPNTRAMWWCNTQEFSIMRHLSD